jgi:hypothetical protein
MNSLRTRIFPWTCPLANVYQTPDLTMTTTGGQSWFSGIFTRRETIWFWLSELPPTQLFILYLYLPLLSPQHPWKFSLPSIRCSCVRMERTLNLELENVGLSSGTLWPSKAFVLSSVELSIAFQRVAVSIKCGIGCLSELSYVMIHRVGLKPGSALLPWLSHWNTLSHPDLFNEDANNA